MGMLRLCATEEIFCDFARPKADMLRLCTTQIRYVAIIATQIGFAATLCAQKICSTLHEPKVCWDHCYSKWVFCNFVQPKYLRDIVRPKIDMVQFPGSRLAIFISTDSTKKWYVSTLWTQAQNVSTDLTQKAVFFSTMFDQRGLFQPSSTEDKPFWPSSTMEKRPMLRLCAFQIGYNATLCDPNYLCCDFVRPKLAVLRLCANHIRYVATLRDPN